MLQAAPEIATTMEVPSLEETPPGTAQSLFGGPRDEARFGGSQGLSFGPSFSTAEVERIRQLIKQHALNVAAEVSPAAVEALAATELERFHEVEGYDHGRMLSKRGRILPKSAVDEIKAMSFFDYVAEVFGDFYFADEDDIGHEQITYRLVRPDRPEDVSSLHCDAWFWEQFGTPLPEGVSRTKVWVPICVEPDLNGLRLAPGSHLREAPYRAEMRGAKLSFIPEFDIGAIGLRQYQGTAGQPILFNYRTLHVGALNRGRNCRVSIETTIMYRSQTS
jgi:hypothetical protein